VDMVEQEVRDLMTHYGYSGEKATVIRGSAKLALEETADKPSALGRGGIAKLLDALDNAIPTPARGLDKPFLMPIESSFTITGRGVVVTGRIEQGTLKLGDEVAIVGGPVAFPKLPVTGLEMFRKQLDNAQAGDNVGALLRSPLIKKEDIMRGSVVCKPGTATAHTKFKAKVYVLNTDEGGRKKPFTTNFKPSFFIRTASVTGTITMEKEKLAMPGDTVEMDVELLYPTPIKDGMRFAIREGQITVGAGVITKVV